MAMIVDNCNYISKFVHSFFYAISSPQQMKHGATRSSKAIYQAVMIQKMIAAIDSNKPLPSISIFEAMKMLTLVWVEVIAKLYRIVFKKSALPTGLRLMNLFIHFPH